MQPRPPGDNNRRVNPRRRGDTQDSEGNNVESSDELELRFSMELIRHAARCVGLDYDIELRGQRTLPLIHSLAELSPDQLSDVLGPFHSDAPLLAQLVEIIRNEDGDLFQVDQHLIQEHVDKGLVFENTSQQEDFVRRLHKIYRNAYVTVPLPVVQQAEMALKRYNARQREITLSLQRVNNACIQLSTHTEKYPKKADNHIVALANAQWSRPTTAPVSRPSNGSVASSEGIASVSSLHKRNPADAVGKLLMHLKRHALAEREQIQREVAIRCQNHVDALSCGEPTHTNVSIKASSTQGDDDESPARHLVSERIRRRKEIAAAAFSNGVNEHQERERKRAQIAEQVQRAQATAEKKIQAEISNAERRRYEFLRTRELQIRAKEARLVALHEAQIARKSEEETEHKEEQEMKTLKHLESTLSFHRQGSMAMIRKASFTRDRHEKALQKASALQKEKEDRARRKEEKHRETVAELEREMARKAAAQSQYQQEIEERRRRALENAKALEEKKKREAQELRELLDIEQDRRAKHAAYLASMKEEEMKLKEQQRRKLVEQYAKARAFRENAFREQWEQELQRSRSTDAQQRAFAAALHQLQLKQEVKLKQILDEKKFTDKDLQRLDNFIAELDELMVESRPL